MPLSRWAEYAAGRGLRARFNFEELFPKRLKASYQAPSGGSPGKPTATAHYEDNPNGAGLQPRSVFFSQFYGADAIANIPKRDVPAQTLSKLPRTWAVFAGQFRLGVTPAIGGFATAYGGTDEAYVGGSRKLVLDCISPSFMPAQAQSIAKSCARRSRGWPD